MISNSQYFMSIARCSSPLSFCSRKIIKLFTARLFEGYTGLWSRQWNLLSREKEYFCFDVELLRECYERSLLCISFGINLYLHQINKISVLNFMTNWRAYHQNVQYMRLRHKFLEIIRSIDLIKLLNISYYIISIMQANQARPINDIYCINESTLLGKGSTGNVYLGFERNNPYNRVAIKVIDLRTIDNQVTRYLLSCQIAALSNLGKIANTGHENIVKLHDIVIQDHFIYLIMEHLEGGTLADYIKRHPQGLNQNEALFIFRQILEGYAHMRIKQIVHRDLKPDNVLFKGDPEKCKKVAIIDFGYCEMQQVPNKPQLYYNVGSPKYMSPEAYRQNNYSQKSDIWALGVIFYEMLAGKTCDHGMSMEKYLEIVEKQGIPLPANISPFHRHILCIMLSYAHNNRLNADQILRQIDSYLNSLNHQKSEVILRTSLQDIDNRMLTQQNFNTRMNKNSTVFQSLILPTNNSGPRRSFNQNNTNSWEKTQYIFERRSVKPGNRMPTIQINSKPVIEFKNNMIPPVNRKSENVEFDSVRDLIHRRPEQNIPPNLAEINNTIFNTTISHNPPHQPEQSGQNFYQTLPKFFQSPQNPANFNVFIDQKAQSALPPKNQVINNSPLPLININSNNMAKKIQFVNNIPNIKHNPVQFIHTDLHSIGTPSNNGIKIKISTPPLLHIQQEKKIEIQSPTESHKYHSPEKQPITVASNVQFFTDKKANIPQPSQSPQKIQRQIINLRPAFVTSQIKAGFTKLQPQRTPKYHQLHNQVPLLKQGFCA